MRERVTYLVRDPTTVGTDTLDVSKTSLQVAGLDAVKEHQITLEQDEIPQELWQVLKNCHELHIRWSTSRTYQAIAPFISRVPSGLHVTFTPLQDQSKEHLCTLIKEAFGKDIKCESVKDAFSTPNVLSERFASSASNQFYAFVPDLQNLSSWIQTHACQEDKTCRLRALDLQKADSFDLDFDAISQAAIVYANWDKSGTQDGHWHETLHKGSKATDTLEIGVLINELPDEPETLRYSGFLTQVGKSDSPSATLFSFPSRHHPLPPSSHVAFSAEFPPPNGLHPTLSLSFSNPPMPPDNNEDCALHAYFTFPSTVFLDKYPFSDGLFLKSHNLRALHGLSGETDLEAPEWVIKKWGSAALFELATPSSPTGSFNVTIPLHARYLKPEPVEHETVSIPFPAVFWACPSENSASKFAVAPFDRTDLGYDGLFGGNTLFYHVPPAIGQKAVAELKVPVLDTEKAESVGIITVGVVVLGALWIVWALWRSVLNNKVQSSTKVAETTRSKSKTKSTPRSKAE